MRNTSISIIFENIATPWTMMAICAGVCSAFLYHWCWLQEPTSPDLTAHEQLIGATPLLKLHILSKVVGRNIFIKVHIIN